MARSRPPRALGFCGSTEIPAGTGVPRIARFAWALAKVFLAALKACLTHRAASKAAALAFYTLFSIAPILVLVIAGAGLLLGTQAAQGAVLDQLKEWVGPLGAAALQNLVAGAQVPGSGRAATALAVVLLGVGATSVFAELKDSLDEIWNHQVPVPTGVLAVLLIWVYYSAQIFFLGAEFTREYAITLGSLRNPGAPPARKEDRELNPF